MDTFKPTYDNSFTIYLIDVDDNFDMSNFEIFGLAYCDIENRNIFVDIEKVNNIDELNFILAHEVAHVYLKHNIKKDDDFSYQEAEADFLALEICNVNNLTKSYKIGLECFKNRHGISYRQFKRKYRKN